MNDSKYRYILYIIVIVILSTIGIQAYWNYKNYLTSKQQLVNDVQISLDNAVDSYYTNLAKRSTFGFSIDETEKAGFFKDGKLDSILDAISLSETDGFLGLDSIDPKLIKGITIKTGPEADSLLKTMNSKGNGTLRSSSDPKTDGDSELENDNSHGFKLLTSKVVLSMTTDSLSLKGIDTLMQSELERKQIDVTYRIKYIDPRQSIDFYDSDKGYIRWTDTINFGSYLQTSSKSSFLPKKSELIVLFHNTSKDIFKRIIGGLLISTLLVLAVISCLFYLLKIIKEQKQLAEVKNDLISNITHEFKTPIATIGVALESIRNFNAIDNREKTMNYLNLSSDQLSKLNIMVEKLLETATLDSENLELNKEQCNITELIQQMVEKHNLQKQGNPIHFVSNPESIEALVDSFHLENAINNIVDNAVKYGGEEISITLAQEDSMVTIRISDSGTSLKKINKDKIFEKFYRVPKGNTHDVKGFGIGLYYTKKIIEKHGGRIDLELKESVTTFKITLPND